VQELTRREYQIVVLLGEGLSNGEIARRLAITRGTVKKHLERIYIKLGVCNRTGAAIQGLRLKPDTKNVINVKKSRLSKDTT